MSAMDAVRGEPLPGSRIAARPKTTSAARTDRPSCHRARGSSAKLIVSESVLQLQFLARRGAKSASPIVLSDGPISASRSKRRSAATLPWTASTRGASSASASVGAPITTVPPRAPPAERSPHATRVQRTRAANGRRMAGRGRRDGRGRPGFSVAMSRRDSGTHPQDARGRREVTRDREGEVAPRNRAGGPGSR